MIQPNKPSATLSREDLLMLCETIPQQVWTANSEGELDFVNGRVIEYFGRTYEEMTGNTWLDAIGENWGTL